MKFRLKQESRMHMADQVELTGAAVRELLQEDTVPKRELDTGDIEYYVWVINDERLRHYLDENGYAYLNNVANDLHSVTLPPQEAQGLWVFAPSVELTNWFETLDDHLQVPKEEVLFAYAKMTNVDERLDDGDYPDFEVLQRIGSHKLYAYPYTQLSTLDNVIMLALESNPDMTDEDLFAQVDVKFNTTQTSQATAQANAAKLADEPVAAVSFDDEDDYGFDTRDVEPLSDSQDDEPSFVQAALSTSEVNPQPMGQEVPKELQRVLSQIETPVINKPKVHVASSQPAFQGQVDDIRDQMNAQLRELSNDGKNRLQKKYFDQHRLLEAKIDEKLDAKTGNSRIVKEYARAEQLNQQDVQDTKKLVAKRQASMAAKVDELHEQFIKEQLAKAEAEWATTGKQQAIDEPVKAYEKGLLAKVEDHRNERLKRVNAWRDGIKSKYLAQVEAPLIEGLMKDARKLGRELEDEQHAARQELMRTEDRLFTQDLERQKQAVYQQSAPAPEPVYDEVVDDDEVPDRFTEDNLDGDEDGFEETAEETVPVDDLDAEDLGFGDDGSVEPDVDLTDDDAVDLGDDLTDDLPADNDLDFEFNDDESDNTSLDTEPVDDVSDEEIDNLLNNTSDVDNIIDDGDDSSIVDLDLDDVNESSDIQDYDEIEDNARNTHAGRSIEDLVNDSTTGEINEQSVLDTFTDDDLMSQFDEPEDEDEDEDVAPTPKSKKVKKPKQPKLKSKAGMLDKLTGKAKDVAKAETPKGTLDRKKIIALIVGAVVAFGVLVALITMLFGGGGKSDNDYQMQPSPTGSYTKGTQLTAENKAGQKHLYVVEEDDGDKIKVSDPTSKKSYTIDKPKAEK